jgi:hypothetical protein
VYKLDYVAGICLVELVKLSYVSSVTLYVMYRVDEQDLIHFSMRQ